MEEARFFQTVASRFEPDLVLVVTFVANDAVEALDRAWRLDDSRPAAVEAQAEAERRLRRIVRRSMVLQIVNQRVEQVTERLRPARQPSPDRRLLSYATPLRDDIAEGFDQAARALAARGHGRRGAGREDRGRAHARAVSARRRRLRPHPRRRHALRLQHRPRRGLPPLCRGVSAAGPAGARPADAVSRVGRPAGDLLSAHRAPDARWAMRLPPTRWRGSSTPTRCCPDVRPMVFNSLEFVLFFVVFYAVYRLLPHRPQNWLLLLASYYFYAAWDWRFLSLLIALHGRRLLGRALPGTAARAARIAAACCGSASPSTSGCSASSSTTASSRTTCRCC